MDMTGIDASDVWMVEACLTDGGAGTHLMIEVCSTISNHEPPTCHLPKWAQSKPSALKVAASVGTLRASGAPFFVTLCREG